VVVQDGKEKKESFLEDEKSTLLPLCKRRGPLKGVVTTTGPKKKEESQDQSGCWHGGTGYGGGCGICQGLRAGTLKGQLVRIVHVTNAREGSLWKAKGAVTSELLLNGMKGCAADRSKNDVYRRHTGVFAGIWKRKKRALSAMEKKTR